MLFSMIDLRRRTPLQNAEAEDCREFGSFDGEAEDQRRVADRDGDDDAEEPTDADGNPR